MPVPYFNRSTASLHLFVYFSLILHITHILRQVCLALSSFIVAFVSDLNPKMFKKFGKAEVQSRSNIKSSAQRGLKSNFTSQYPDIEPVIDNIIPKKSQAILIKCEDKILIYSVDHEVVVFQTFHDLVPTLKTVHKYPDCFQKVQVDRGAIKFVLSGANVMCPGLTSAGAKLPDTNFKKDSIVTIYAEGKETALAVGRLTMCTDDIKEKNKGIGIELLHYLGDGLWLLDESA